VCGVCLTCGDIVDSGQYSTLGQLNDTKEAVIDKSSYYHIQPNRCLSILSLENRKSHSFWNTLLFFCNARGQTHVRNQAIPIRQQRLQITGPPRVSSDPCGKLFWVPGQARADQLKNITLKSVAE